MRTVKVSFGFIKADFFSHFLIFLISYKLHKYENHNFILTVYEKNNNFELYNIEVSFRLCNLGVSFRLYN